MQQVTAGMTMSVDLPQRHSMQELAGAGRGGQIGNVSTGCVYVCGSHRRH